ncbi:acetylglutamate kinase [Marivibrio halodurans]|uniref:Acetylglutamate kinase n=1 Tax=Marivibrio halodurans TaxID=2039722 RepID=A0A8J7S3I8_9PROT|nr:acetylglutamate kinase [Marivibrio halodurans]MBP5858044.1 acetylglutamate kinase [Marivibrio halodurans]
MTVDKARRRVEWLAQAGILTEALPFMRRYTGKTLIIKYGGHAMGDAALAQLFARDVVLLKQVGVNPIVVHGGGPQIGEMLTRMAKESEFIDGLRVTDAETVDIVEMVLSGRINKQIVASLQEAGGYGIGLSGKDGALIRARKLTRTIKDPESNIEKVLDLGFVGEPEEIDPTILDTIKDTNLIPVIAPIGLGAAGETYNINADTAAGAIAGGTGARRLLLLTDVPGVLDKDGELIREMTVSEAETLQARGIISGGMIPKVQTCVDAVRQGAEAAVILDGRLAHVILLELFTEHGSGTIIRPD